MVAYSIPRAAFGVYLTVPPITNLPADATVARVRMRAGEFVVVYLKRAGRFERWNVDHHPAGFVLTCPTAINIRPGG